MYSRPNLSVTPGISWLPTFAFQSTILKRTSFFGVLVLESLVGLHRTIQLKLLQHYWSGHRLGFLWYWMVFLGNEERSFCHFWDCIQVPWTTFPLFYHWTLALKTLLFSLCLGKNPSLITTCYCCCKLFKRPLPIFYQKSENIINTIILMTFSVATLLNLIWLLKVSL